MAERTLPGILAVDAGNTRVKWGVHDGREWCRRASFATAAAGEKDAFSHLPRDPEFAAQIERVIVSNVAGSRVGEHIRDALYHLGKPIHFIDSNAGQCGVTSRYEPPAALGTDRWAAMIAAFTAQKSTPLPLLVVMSGTALTVDALNAQGVFLGGIIVPGLALMRAALNRATAQLPLDAGRHQVFPRNTFDAISTGGIEACSGAVQRMYAQLAAQTAAEPHCVGSGGAMHRIAPHLPFPVTINDNLVLDGLREIALNDSNP